MPSRRICRGLGLTFLYCRAEGYKSYRCRPGSAQRQLGGALRYSGTGGYDVVDDDNAQPVELGRMVDGDDASYVFAPGSVALVCLRLVGRACPQVVANGGAGCLCMGTGNSTSAGTSPWRRRSSVPNRYPNSRASRGVSWYFASHIILAHIDAGS